MTKQFARYDSYKDSGVEWLGQIPVHWNVQKLNSILTVKSEKNKPDLPLLSVYREYGVILKDSRDDNHNAAALDLSTYKVVDVGDFVINKMKAWQGSMGVSQHAGIVSPAYITCKVAYELMNSKYLHSLLRCNAYIGEYNRLSYGVRIGQWDMHFEDFKNIPLCIMPIEEQQRIADFLDKKTAQIDEAIAQKEKMIELLKEYRQVTINNAVTKGLDPNVPMKDSSIEWLGQIPAHWKLISLKRIITLLTDYTANGSFGDLAKNVQYLDEPNYAKLIRLTDIRSNFEDKCVYISQKSYRYLRKSCLFGGELLMANVGAYSGHSFLLPEKLSFNASLAPNMFLIKFDTQKIQNKFIFYVLNCDLILNQLTLLALSSAQPKLNKNNVRNIYVSFPNLTEQKQIVELLDKKVAQVEAEISLKHAEIEKLKEYKATLIDSAVTGKIKV